MVSVVASARSRTSTRAADASGCYPPLQTLSANSLNLRPSGSKPIKGRLNANSRRNSISNTSNTRQNISKLSISNGKGC